MNVYISYANEDIDLAEKIKNKLIKKNINCIYVNHLSSEVNDDCTKKMLYEIKNNDLIVFLMTENANYSSLLSIELVASIKRKKRIIALKCDDCNISENLLFSLNNYKIIYEYSLKKTINKLIDLIQKGDEYE